MKITYKILAGYLKQSEQNFKNMKRENPKKLELYKCGLLYMLEHELITEEELKALKNI